LLDSAAEQVLGYLTDARWFAGKGRLATLRSLTPLPWLNDTAEFFAESGPAVRLEIAEVAYAAEQDPADRIEEEDPEWAGGPRRAVAPDGDEPREFYQLALSYRPAPHPDLHSAEVARTDHPELGSVVVYDATQDPEACRVILQALVDEARLNERDTTTRFHRTGRAGLTADLSPRVFTGQQSNTSVVLGDVAMLKLFRRLELGRNADIEVHDALNRAGVPDVAGLFGWAEGSWTTDGVTRDADLAMVVELLSGAADGWGLALDRLEAGQSFAADAEALGRALAETHAALRDAFPVAEVPGRSVAEVMAARLSVAVTAAPSLSSHSAGLRQCFAALDGRTLATQRVHGDFHLGQTLHTPNGWKIIDFEGEPAKTMAERVVPDSVWRDVAGMLRSFDYAAASMPGADSASWAQECRVAFLRGYTGGDLDPPQADAVRAYEADKAIYEVVYEVRNRPDWVRIPLGAVATLAQTERPSDPGGTPPEPPTVVPQRSSSDGS
jgi:maltokinase